MKRYDLVVQEKHLASLKAHLLPGDGKEHAAYVLFGEAQIVHDPFDNAERNRFMIKEILPVEADEIVSADERHISWSTQRFVQLLGVAERANLRLGIAHSHPHGPSDFSQQDDRNEADLFRLIENRNGQGQKFVSLLITDKSFRGRVWSASTRRTDFEAIRTVGPRWTFRTSRQADDQESPALARQALALGPEFNRTVSSLRVGVVGAGGTGSPLIQQLARLGVGFLGIFDPDTVETSNLNRLYGASYEDALQSTLKVDVARREVERMGLGTKVSTFSSWIGSSDCRDALKSMDVIFGCTDDNDGRSLLNRLAYYYLIPVIDLGLALRVTRRGNEDQLDAEGRVTVLEPGAPCLSCRKVINFTRAAEEALLRNDPEEYERRKAEAYVRGEGNPAPAVVSFTTSVATMAIEELLQRLQQFRGSSGHVANRLRKFTLMEDFRPGAATVPCRICNSEANHGVGDVEPFLGRVG